MRHIKKILNNVNNYGNKTMEFSVYGLIVYVIIILTLDDLISLI